MPVRVLVSVRGELGGRIADALTHRGAVVVGWVDPADIDPDAVVAETGAGIDAVVVAADTADLTADLVRRADRLGARLVVIAGDEAGRRRAAVLGLGRALPADASPDELIDAVAGPLRVHSAPPGTRPGVLAVWGAHGAPGRTRLAIECAVALAQAGCGSALADADTHAPGVALALGIADEGPGFASICRAAHAGGLDEAELGRVSQPVHVAGAVIEVLPGINRPARWPELAGDRVAAALRALRAWSEATVVDVAPSLEADEELASDLFDVPRRNAATRAVLREADRVLAVVSAEPIGIARFVRAWPEVRELIGAVPVTVVVNRLRAGPLGLDARGQVRRAIEQYTGIGDISFVPEDRRAVDAGVLAARPVAAVAPRSAFSVAVRRLVRERLLDGVPAAAQTRARRVPAARRSPVGLGRVNAQ